jgi:hypothetical protein
VVDLLRSVKTISKRKFCSTLFKAAPDNLLVSSLLVSITRIFWAYDYPVLIAIFIFLTLFLIKVAPSLKSLLNETADIDACKTLDEYLGLKDRILSWYLLKKGDVSEDRRTLIIEQQAEPVVSGCNLNAVVATNLPFRDIAKIILAIAALGFLFFFSKPHPPAHASTSIASKIEQAINDPLVPPEIKKELLKVKEAIENHVSTEQIQGLADQALSTIEAFDSNVASTSEGETAPAPNPSSSSPFPTPTYTPTYTPTPGKKGENNKPKNDQRVDNQNTVPSKDNKSPKDNSAKENSAEQAQQPQDPKASPTSSFQKSQSPQDGNPQDSKRSESEASPKNDNKGQDSKGQKESDREKAENGQSDKNKNSGKGEEQKDKNKNNGKGEEQKDKPDNSGKGDDKRNNQDTENKASGKESQKETKPEKKDGEGDRPEEKQGDQKNGEQDQSKQGKEGKPEKDGNPSKKQDSGGAKSDSMMSLSRAKEALNQLKTQNPEKDSPKNADEKNEAGKSPGKLEPDENSEKTEKAQKEKGVGFGKKDSELALEPEKKKGKGDKPNLPSSTKYKDELITIEQGKIDRNQVGKSTGTKKLPKGVAPKTSQEEVAVPLESLTEERGKQRIPLEYEHLLRE